MNHRILALAMAVGLSGGLLCAQDPAPPPQAPPQPPSAPLGNLFLQNASLNEVIDQLARQLQLNLVIDPSVKGSVSINTYGDTRNIDARSLLDMVLRINGFAMVQEGPLYRIVPMAQINRQPLRPQVNAKDMPEDDQMMLNMVFLKYVTVDELVKILTEFTGENAVLRSYAPANLLFILDNRRNMHRTMELINLFDSDSFTGERVRLFEIQNTRPSDLQKELETILRSISLDNKTPTVRFLAVDRIGTLIAVAPNPGVFDTVEDWIRKLDIAVTATSGTSDTYVYRVRYGRADCLAIALTQLYSPFSNYGGGQGGYQGYPTGNFGNQGNYNPYGSQGGIPYGGGGNYGAFNQAGGSAYGGSPNSSNYGNGNAFAEGFGGTGSCGFTSGQGAGGYGGGGYGYPTFGGYAAQTPQPAPGQPGAPPAGGTQTNSLTVQNQQPPPKVVPNPLDNSLLIQADAAQYQGILKLLKQLDVPPRQILLEAKIYQVDMSGAFASGVTARFQAVTGAERRPLANLVNGLASFSVGTLVGQSRELLTFLSLSENATNAHVISEPSLIATDSIPARINVGTQVPVLTSQVASPVQVGGTNTINQQISSRNTGVTLNVNARVNPSGIVTLLVNQEISKPSGNTDTLTPQFSQQVVQTQLTIHDGDTIAIGGIIAENGSETSQGIPVLHRIPWIGLAFGSKTYNHSRSEFIIFMTPHVIYDTADLLEASDELVSRVKRLRKYMK